MDEDDEFKMDEDMMNYDIDLPKEIRHQKAEIAEKVIERIVTRRIKEKEEELLKQK